MLERRMESVLPPSGSANAEPAGSSEPIAFGERPRSKRSVGGSTSLGGAAAYRPVAGAHRPSVGAEGEARESEALEEGREPPYKGDETVLAGRLYSLHRSEVFVRRAPHFVRHVSDDRLARWDACQSERRDFV